jgi:hypothetical protein
MGDTINWGIFKRRFWGELLRHQQPVGQDAKQQMAGQVRRRLPPKHGVPTGAKLADAEIAQARNLGVE